METKLSSQHYKTFTTKKQLLVLQPKEILNELSGGCSAPVGAKVSIEEGEILFHGVVLDTEGKEKIEIVLKKSLEEAGSVGKREAAQLAIAQGADKLIASAKK